MYDLLVLAFNEKKSSRLRTDKICIKALNRLAQKRQKYYYKVWSLINNSYGVLYKLFTKESFGEFECCDEMFEFNNTDDSVCSLKPFIPNIEKECVCDWVSMKLNSDYKDAFISIFDMLLSCSPISTVAFLCRGQSFDKEVVVGVVTHNDFIEMLSTGNIKANICYLVKRDL